MMIFILQLISITVKFKQMLKNYLIHKRNTSQSIKIDQKPKQNLVEKIKSHKNSKSAKNKSNTLSLIEKSSKKISNKHTVVENLDSSQNGENSPFFAFGQKVQQKNWNLDVDKITQVQDSNSRRQFTSHRSARGPSNCSKQNYNTSNFDDGLRKSTKSKSNNQRSKQRNSNNKSRNEKTKSTISLSRVKYTKDLQIRTQKMQKSVKMLWQCMGQLWQNSRVSQYKSQRNNESINGLKRKLEQQQQKLLQIKFQISKSMRNNNEKIHLGLRA